jgi:hypothetical protein
VADKGSKVGDVHFDVHANVDTLSPDLKKAQAKIAEETGGGDVSNATANYAKKLEKEGSGISAWLRRGKKDWGEQVEVVQGLIGKVAAVGATAVIAYKTGEAAFNAFSEVIKNATDRAQDFKDTLDLTDVAGSLKKYDDELADLDAQMAGRREGNILGRISRLYKSDEDLQKEINQKREAREALARTDKAKKDGDNRNKASKETNDKSKEDAKQYLDLRTNTLDKLATEQRSAELDMMDERKRASEESSDKIDALDKEFRKLSFADQMKYEAQFDASRNAINAAYFAKKRKWQDEDTKKQLEDAKKVADAWVSSFRSIREASNSVFNTDQAASMVQFSQQMMVSATIAHANMNRITVEGVG